MEPLTRRRFLAGAAGAGLAAGWEGWPSSLAQAGATAAGAPASPEAGELLEVLPCLNEGPVRHGELVGRGLGGRRTVDLADLAPDRLITPPERFFVRTRLPEYLADPGSLRLSARSLWTSPIDFSRADLEALARPMGVHLLECTDNGRENGFGLVSAAEWTGVPLGAIFERTGKPAEIPWLLLVEGFDQHVGVPLRSVAGASWVFSPADLAATGAFLATGMNGAPLAPDHGFPFRLVVPGWYGCAWIKWVTQLIFVPEHTLATPQMEEFAARTGQPKRRKLARDFRPAAVEHAALPVRVEKRREEGGVAYRVVGLLWGGARPATGLAIRFRPEDPWTTVEGFTSQVSTATWTLWSHRWKPPGPGRYHIDLRVEPPDLPGRRLNAGHYRRVVEVRQGAGQLRS